MKLNEYQKKSIDSAFYTGSDKMHALGYLALGLTEEAGETAGKIKKLFRDNDGKITDEIRESIGNELGDTLWYLSVLANKLGYSLEDIALLNINKIHDRNKRGVQRGSGDNR